VREESPNGGANWRLACGERRCVVTLAMGEKRHEKEASIGFFLFIGEGEREGGILVPPIRDSRPTASRSSWTTTRIGSPMPRSLTGGAQSVFLKPARVRITPGLHYSWAQPAKI
jgi:hypothetical protein